MKKNKYMGYLTYFFTFFGGSVLFGLSMNMFLEPANVVMGGLTGVATTINYLNDKIPIGATIFVLNLPLLIVNIKVYGFKSMIKSVIGIGASSLAVDLTKFVPATLTDPLLCAILGGVTMGAGAGLLLSQGFTTGGSDLSAVLLKRKFKRLTTGRLVLIVDVFVILGAALVMKSWEGIIYSAIATFAYSAAIDAVMGGAEKAKMALIISSRHAELAKRIDEVLSRGVTYLHGEGWYTGSEKEVLMCVVKRDEEFTLKQITEGVDRDAFMILCDATEVLGSGFKETERRELEEAEEKAKKKAERASAKAAKKDAKREAKAAKKAAKKKK